MQHANDSFGQRLRTLRQQQALTQVELAEHAGVSEAAIIRLERETHTPRPSTVRKIAAALGVEPSQLTAAV